MRKLLVLFSSFCLLFISACDELNEEQKNADSFIYTSIYPIQFIVDRLTNEDTYVQSIYPAGVDAHTYEPTSREITNMAEADAFIFLGNHLEGFADTAANALANQPVQLIELSEHEELFHRSEPYSSGDIDPHIWLDPLRMIDMAEYIKEDLTRLLPEQADELADNLEKLTTDLTTLDEAFKTMVDDKVNKDIVVTHAAYSYWEERYGIKQIPISGISTSDEPSQRDLVKIVNAAKDKQIKHVIFDQLSDHQTGKIIQEHLDAKALHIHNLETLTEKDIEEDEDYLSLMYKNIETLDEAMK